MTGIGTQLTFDEVQDVGVDRRAVVAETLLPQLNFPTDVLTLAPLDFSRAIVAATFS
jgi:hypothetical protein